MLTFQDFVCTVQKEVQEEIEHSVTDKDMRYAMEGGKLLRPVMLILSYKACVNGNNKYYSNALESAVGMELAHAASLVHDDIMDNDDMRRGKLALHVKEGLGSAILTGHRMISTAFRISLEHGVDNALIFLDTWDNTLIGQLRDIDLNEHLEKIFNGGNSKDMLIQEYLKVIEMKTASLFATACRAGAIEAHSTPEVQALMAEYGKNVGLAYQIADDMVDIVEGKLEEGIIMPLMKAYGNGLNEDVIEMLKNGRVTLEEELAKQGSSLEEVYRNGINTYVRKSQQVVESSLIPDSPYKYLLREAPVYITNKMTGKIGVRV